MSGGRLSGTGLLRRRGQPDGVAGAPHPGGRAHCPVDDWTFDPRYTDGVCPLCGWRPPGAPIEPPVSARIDWFWPTVGLMAAVSILMAVLVLVAYARA